MISSNLLVRFEIPAFYHLQTGLSRKAKRDKNATEFTLSSPHEKRYGCLELTARPLTVEMWPVMDNLSSPVARFQILMILSPAPVANHSFPGSTATARTHPRWPDRTLCSFHCGWKSGFTARASFRRISDWDRSEGCCCAACGFVRVNAVLSEPVSLLYNR